MTNIDPAAVMAAHPGDVHGEGWSWCHKCDNEWPCEPYRLAEALLTAEERATTKERERWKKMTATQVDIERGFW